MIWNDFGAKFYVWGGADRALSSLIVLLSPWLMPVLFVVAGMAARYSLQKRSPGDFLRERARRLLIPLLCGTALFVPFQTLFARRFFFGYDGTVAQHFRYFFTNIGDMNGYDGKFTFGHLWFLLYLFLISAVTLPVCKRIPSDRLSARTDNIGTVSVLLLFVPVCLSHYIGNFGGQSLGKYLLLYLAGYYLFSDTFVERLVSARRWILSLFAVSQLTLTFLYFRYGFYGDILVNFVCWLGVLSCIIAGRLFLDRKTTLSEHFRMASFPMYILHQTILVAIAFCSLRMTDSTVLQIGMIMSLSFGVTYICYIMIGKVPVLRTIAGIK